MAKAKSLVPRSERRRSSYGSLLMSMQTSGDLCELGRKCIRHRNHGGTHYPM